MTIKYAHGGKVDAMEVRRAMRWLRERYQNGGTFEDGLYHAYIDPAIEYDLLSDPAITSVYQYGGSPRGESNPLLKGSIPSVYGIKFFRVSEQPPILDGDYVLITKSAIGGEYEFFTSIFRSADEVPAAIEIDWSHGLPTDIS